MSGGSWDYVSYRLEEVGDQLLESSDSKRKELGALVLLVAIALHDIEWADSSDYSPGDEEAAIDAALQFGGTKAVVKEAELRALWGRVELYENALRRMRDRVFILDKKSIEIDGVLMAFEADAALDGRTYGKS